MTEDFRIRRDDAVAVMIDFQERLIPAMHEKEFIEDRAIRFAEGMRALNVPILVTQQYTRGLGPTIPSVSDALGDFRVYDKKVFSAWEQEEFREAIEATGKKTVILCGVETHICVMQTAFDLLDNGYKVFVAEDACGSRHKRDHRLGTRRMRQAGVKSATVESALMEILGGAGAPEFKTVSSIIK